MKTTKCPLIGCVFGAALLAALTGCLGPNSNVRLGGNETVYTEPTEHVESAALVPDDYVYYPRYAVYYASTRRQYVYLDGTSWLSRPTPPKVSTDVLLASPSVRLDFRDHPALHNDTTLRQYPKNWTPPEASRSPAEDNVK